MELRKSVSIIVPNYNGRQLLQQSLPFTVAAIENTGVVYEIIIVDDGSADDSVEFIRLAYRQVVLIENPENKGLSYAYNRGIEASRYDLILLLSPDIKLSPDYFERQWKYFLRWDAFGVMGRIADAESDSTLAAGCVPKSSGFKLKTDYLFYTGNEDDRLYTLYLSGANALMDAVKLKQIGGFYELFAPVYCGDTELGIRAGRLNWKCYYEHNSVCWRQPPADAKGCVADNMVKSAYFSTIFYLHAIHLNGYALKIWYLQILITDVLPKLLAGQTWIWKCYTDMFKNKKLIGQYKHRIKELMDTKDTRLTFFNVTNKIRASVKNKQGARFRPQKTWLNRPPFINFIK